MNLYFLSAALLLIVTATIHSIAGEKLLLIPTLKLEIQPLFGSTFLARRTLRFAWHLMTLFWLAIATVLILFARQPVSSTDIVVVQVFSFTFFFSGILSLVGGKGKHFSWFVFLAIAILLWLGLQGQYQ